MHALPADPSVLPLLRQPTRLYWLEHLPAEDILYLQLNRSGEMENVPFAAFQEAFFEELERRQPSRLVIDLRFNPGGNLDITQPLFERIARMPLAQEQGRLLVITGGQTFSVPGQWLDRPCAALYAGP